MLKKITADGRAELEFIKRLRERESDALEPITRAVAGIIADVRERGDAALAEYTEKFDGVKLEKFEIDLSLCRDAAAGLGPKLLLALQRAAARISDFHSQNIPKSWVKTSEDGVVTGQRARALARVGVYVPGGTAAYPSSVLMNVLPAKCAGVEEIIMLTPPGNLNPAVMAAAFIAGVDRIFTIGGAQAIAALAYGTESVPRVDKIVGPGNIYVAEAKRQVYGVTDIDMVAGPSEILVIAEESADPKFAAADLLSQAEHDVLASAILLCFSEEKAEAVMAELTRQLALLPRREIAEKSLEDFGAAIICRDMAEAIKLSNLLAPEHLEIMADDPFAYLGSINNAGSVFLGHYAPEAFGDYMAGPNHVLPTGGRARFFSPLSCDDFIKKSGFIYSGREALAALKDDITAIAYSEGLDAHAKSVEVRFDG